MAILAVTEPIRSARAKWRYRGADRPLFAVEPGAGEESVWDYPRPPVMEPENRLVRVTIAGREIARSTRAVRVLETAGAPTIYLPPGDVVPGQLVVNETRSICEWKGLAVGFDLSGGPEDVAWSYRDVFPEFAAIAGRVSFYPAKLECWLGDERVRPQPGGYYGGWVTDEIRGPIKGEPDTHGL